ncbi:hypothetical protein [Oligoflexus tunisiensis]|uniref:hypothetical protein n=1 Tax=Oligoflexus tunisiensis TaxID=708132 RepID=UPI00114CA462|nr:hypothetical protein [Oligoflexus tunisiensis]
MQSSISKAAGLFAVLVSTSLFGQVIYQPSAANCKRPGPAGAFRFCSGAPVIVPFSAITSTLSKYVVNVPIENTLSYRLYCPAFPDSTPVDLAVGTSHQMLLASSQAVAEKIRQSVNYTALGASTYVFSPQINYSATYQPTCRMEVISNVSVPDVDMLRTIVGLLSDSYTQLADLKTSVDEAAELPAKWVVIKDSPATIEDLANGLVFEVNSLQQELDALTAADAASLSVNDTTRLAAIPGIIESYQSSINDLARLKSDLSEVAKVAEQCEANVNDAFCVESVTKVSEALDASTVAKKSELVEINQFLKAESDRLKATSISVSNALKRLISKLD